MDEIIYIVEDDEGIRELYEGAFEGVFATKMFENGKDFFCDFKVFLHGKVTPSASSYSVLLFPLRAGRRLFGQNASLSLWTIALVSTGRQFRFLLLGLSLRLFLALCRFRRRFFILFRASKDAAHACLFRIRTANISHTQVLLSACLS